DKFSERDRECYRWVFEHIDDSRNFDPVYVLDEERKQNTCKGYALSFFDESDNAIKRLSEIAKDKENVFKKLGTHIAKGVLNKSDGISEDSDSITHFNHFEYEDVSLNAKFEIIQKIAP